MSAKNAQLTRLKTGKIKHLFKITFVPHKNNEYRPHLIRHYGLVVVIITVIGSQFFFSSAMAEIVAGKQTDITVESLFEQTNKEREQSGIAPLLLDEKLNKAAKSKAQDMFDRQYWSHESPDGVKPWKWLESEGYNYSKAGENLARDYPSTEAVITAWMNSTEHRQNILSSDYKDVGFAVVDNEYGGRSAEFVVAFYGLSTASVVADSHQSFISAVLSSHYDFWSRLDVATKSITPLTMICLVMIMVAIIVAMWSHFHRRKLPAKFQRTWRKHHGIYKATGLFVFGLSVILIYASGQI